MKVQLMFLVVIFMAAFMQANSASLEPVCQRPAYTGDCRAHIDRYFYNAVEGECQLFVYGGCKSNGNNFETKEACEELCAN